MESGQGKFKVTCKVPGLQTVEKTYDGVTVFTQHGTHAVLQSGVHYIAYYPCEYTVIEAVE